jgi:hypothetical protein
MRSERAIEAWRMLPLRTVPWGSLSRARKLLLVVLLVVVLAVVAFRLTMSGTTLAYSGAGPAPEPASKLGLMMLPVLALLAIAAVISERTRPPEARPSRLPHWQRREPARLGVDGIALGVGDFVRYAEIVALSREGDLLIVEAGRPEPIVLAVVPGDLMRAEERIESGRHVLPAESVTE